MIDKINKIVILYKRKKVSKIPKYYPVPKWMDCVIHNGDWQFVDKRTNRVYDQITGEYIGSRIVRGLRAKSGRFIEE